MAVEIGERVGDYEILAMIGAGGMGRVYKVRNIFSNREEAMKVLLPDLTTERELAARFMMEIRTLASLDHPNIAQLRTAFQFQNQLVMIMEYVEGVGSGTQLGEAFALNPGQVSGAISVGTNQVLFKVVSHTPANEADFAPQRDQLREELLDQKRDLQFEIYRENLKDQFIRNGKLKFNDAGMKQYLVSYEAQ